MAFAGFRPLALAAALVLLVGDVSNAGSVMPRDPRDGVLDSSLIVIVSQAKADSFRIEQVLLGEKKAGDCIKLPGFRLYTPQEWGPELVEALTQDTRVLLFLKVSEKTPGSFEVTWYGECFFWVQDAAKAGDLRRMGEDAVKLRRAWEEAKGIRDERKRVEALWPYLWNHNRSFLEHTQKALQATGPAAGDYIAERLPGMTHNERMTLLHRLGDYGGERLHALSVERLRRHLKDYDTFLERRGPDKKNLIADWRDLPEEMQATTGEIYYGLAGLARFKDRGDLPFVRELVVWAADRGLRQTCEEAFGAFRDMPDKANLPMIASVWEKSQTWPGDNSRFFLHTVMNALLTHRMPEAVPLLVRLLDEDRAGARRFLREIVGRDLGPDPQPWLDWYEAEKKTGSSQ